MLANVTWLVSAIMKDAHISPWNALLCTVGLLCVTLVEFIDFALNMWFSTHILYHNPPSNTSIIF
jgi:hypothetical protein